MGEVSVAPRLELRHWLHGVIFALPFGSFVGKWTAPWLALAWNSVAWLYIMHKRRHTVSK